MCCIFPRVERNLVFFVIFFRAWNALWYYCVVFSARGTRSGVIVLHFSACGTHSRVIVLYFPRVERTLVFCVIVFWVCNAFWRYCVIFSTCVGPAHGTCSSIIVLYFPCMEHALALLCYIFQLWRARSWNALWGWCVIFSAHGTRSVVIVLYFSECDILTLWFARVYFIAVLV